MSKELNEDELWGLIDKFNWSLDHDYIRIRGEIENLTD